MEQATTAPLSDKDLLSCALGCFDGVHLGHRALLEAAVRNFQGYTPAVWTFSGPTAYPYIENVPSRLALCRSAGIEKTICEDFEMVRNMQPAEFIAHLRQTYKIGHIVCGEDFRFGRDRVGDTEMLKAICLKNGISVTVVSPVMADTVLPGLAEEKISSSLIRRLIAGGEVDKAGALLGRRFSIQGEVIGGRRLGRTMNLPTVNQRLENGRILPAAGVYDTVCTVNGKRYVSVTNVGYRPTVNNDEHDVTCETHIIDAPDTELDLYGLSVTVEFCRYGRPEKRFSSLDELKTAIEGDIKRAREYFKNFS